MHKNKQNFVRCVPCFNEQQIVLQFCKNNKWPHIAQDGGTIFRQGVVSDHFNYFHHKVAVRACKISSLPPLEAALAGPISDNKNF